MMYIPVLPGWRLRNEKRNSPPAEPLKEENMPAFRNTAEGYRAQIDTIQAAKLAAEMFEML